MITWINDKGYDKVFYGDMMGFGLDYWVNLELFFDGWNWRVVMIGRLGGVMDFGVGVWMNQLCEFSKCSDNLLILTTPV